MQLHRLRLAGIGPFAGEHEIDFAALGAGGLFLLEGPTGAGKSTIVDAIVYALYGNVAGASASKERIRSGFAEPGQESFVDLVFETGSGLYRVRRSPEWQRPKKRGEGTTKVQASASLWRLTSPEDLDGGEHMSGRLDEVGAEIEQAIGLNRAQFVQTIVLPQGEFATFLKAKPEERRQVLQRVFGTESYERVQEELAELKKEALARLGAAQQEIERSVGGLCGVLGPFEDASVEEALFAAAREGEGLEELVAARVAEAESAVGVEDARLAEVRARAEALRAEAAAARDRRDAARKVLALLERRAVLLAGAEEQDARLERLDAARRAAAVAGALAGETKAVAAEHAAAAALEELEVEVSLRSLERSELVAVRDAAQRDAGALDGALRLAAETEQRAKELASTRTELAVLEESLLALDAQIAARPAVLAGLKEQLGTVRPLAEGRGKAELGLEHAEGRLLAARAVAAVRGEIVQAQSDVARLAEEATKRIEEEARLRALRVAGIAGELAKGLAGGDPCPVCGSTEHPAPAALTPDHADEDQVNAAEEDRRAAEQVLAAAKLELARLEAVLAGHLAESGGLSEEEAEAAVASARAALDAAREAVAERERLSTEIDEATETDAALAQQRAEIAKDIAGHRSSVRSLEKQLAKDATALEEARGEFASVEERRAHLESRCSQAESLLSALDRLAESRAQLASRRAELEASLAENGFASAEAASESALSAAELRALEEAVSSYREELARVAEGLADRELAASLAHESFAEALGLAPTELDPESIDLGTLDPGLIELEALDEASAAAAAVLEEAEAALREASAAAAVARKRAEDGARCQGELLELLEQTASVREEAVPVVRMAELAQGTGPDNPRRLTLATYVLLRRFEEVVEVANERLAIMSDGRYALERSDERESGGGLRQGLALRVRDNTIDSLRDPHTLSGGETFYVSLCLALALAQVVTAEAGGVDLGTLFVDEGFGTLDPHVLEAVLSQLGALHAEGRVVGIISHVSELKDAIAERIEVRKTAHGPSVLRVVA